jgi:small-conductance mechanosensitive channel
MDWILKQAQQILRGLSHLFTTQFFVIGDKKLSLSSIVVLILLALAVFIVSHFISEGIKRGLLVRMGMSRGSREAVGAVIHYLLAALGFLIVLQTAGINLSSITVLAGVLGIGVGFGLQNLASNFISGVTLLVEQPIKVGDFIEVEKLLGTVEKFLSALPLFVPSTAFLLSFPISVLLKIILLTGVIKTRLAVFIFQLGWLMELSQY